MAPSVVFVQTSSPQTTMQRVPKSTLKNKAARNIDFGKNEGSIDSLEKYFFDSGIVDKLGNDKRTLIIGRKGTGKTAIASHLSTRAIFSYNNFTNVMSFRDVPVNLLESFSDENFSASGKFVSAWKLILLIELSKQIVKNETIAPDSEQKLRAIIECVAPTLESSPLDYLEKTRENNFRIDMKVAQFGESEHSRTEKVDLTSYVSALQRQVISTVTLSDSYTIILDELDDSYSLSTEYLNLVTAIFKSVADLNRLFFKERTQLCVIVALRDDIYDSIEYSDKNKWDDSAIRLDWIPKPGIKSRDTDLFKMINLRIGASYLEEPDIGINYWEHACLLYTSPSPRDQRGSRMPSSA